VSDPTERFVAELRAERTPPALVECQMLPNASCTHAECRAVTDPASRKAGPVYVTRTVGRDPEILARYSRLEIARENAAECNAIAHRYGWEPVAVYELLENGFRLVAEDEGTTPAMF
jgi:hypothetical protein